MVRGQGGKAGKGESENGLVGKRI